MAEERNYYVICEDKCLFPAMTKEQILSAIAQATGGTIKDIDSAFLTKIMELNGGNNLTFWVGTTAQYNAIKDANELTPNCFYITTDDTFAEDIEADITAMRTEVNALSTAVTPLTYDSGWLDIKRKAKPSLGDTTYIIGKYRVIGKTVYVNIEYSYNDFTTTSTTTDTIVLPVLLDCPPASGVQGYEYQFIAVEDRLSGTPYTYRVARIGAYTKNLTIANISTSGDYDMTRISFSAPYKGVNPDYTL